MSRVFFDDFSGDLSKWELLFGDVTPTIVNGELVFSKQEAIGALLSAKQNNNEILIDSTGDFKVNFKVKILKEDVLSTLILGFEGGEPSFLGYSEIIESILIGDSVVFFVIDEVRNKAYVKGHRALFVVDLSTKSFTRIDVEGDIIAYNKIVDEIYICGAGSRLIKVYNPSDLSAPIDEINLDFPVRYIVSSSTSGRIYISSEGKLGIIERGQNPNIRSIDLNFNLYRLAVNDNINMLFAAAVARNEPYGISVNPVTNRVYVANKYSGTVSVIDGANNAIIATINVGGSPYDVSVNPNTNRIYVTNYSSRTVSIINGANNTVITTIDTENRPCGIAVNTTTNRVYVAAGNSLLVIDGANNNIVATIDIEESSPYDVSVNPNTNRIYVTNRYNNTVSVIDGVNNTVIATINVGVSPHGISVNPSTNRIYVANYSSGTISVIDGANNDIISTVNVEGSPYGVSVNPDTNRIYVTSCHNNIISVIDGVNNNVITTIDVGILPYGISVNPSTSMVYVTNHFSNTISIIDGVNNNVIASINPIAIIAFNLTNDTYSVVNVGSMYEGDKLFDIETNKGNLLSNTKIYATLSKDILPYQKQVEITNDLIVVGYDTGSGKFKVERRIGLSGHAYGLRGVRYNNNKIYIASYGIPGMGGIDGKLIIMNAANYGVTKVIDKFGQAVQEIGIRAADNKVYVLRTTFDSAISIIDGNDDTYNLVKYLHGGIVYNHEWIIAEYEYDSSNKIFYRRIKFEGDTEWKVVNETNWDGGVSLPIFILVVTTKGGGFPGTPTDIESRFDDVYVYGTLAGGQEPTEVYFKWYKSSIGNSEGGVINEAAELVGQPQELFQNVTPDQSERGAVFYRKIFVKNVSSNKIDNVKVQTLPQSFPFAITKIALGTDNDIDGSRKLYRNVVTLGSLAPNESRGIWIQYIVEKESVACTDIRQLKVDGKVEFVE